MYTLGIDFGKKGGFALLKDSVILQKWVMPLTKDNVIDPEGVCEIAADVFTYWSDTIEWTNDIMSSSSMPVKIYGEILHAVYGSSAKSTFSFGQAYGTVIGVIEANLGPINLIRAVDWQKAVFKELNVEEVKKPNSNRRDTKRMALHAALKQWPEEVWVESPRHRRVHDGMVDAALIGLYGEQQ